MTQEAIQLSTTPPYPGLAMVQDANGALATIATDFAGSSDPAAFAGPFMTWADTANNLIKRRNVANTAWVQEGALLRSHIPSIPLAELPGEDIGLVFVPDDGFYRWVSGAYVKSDLSFSVISTLKTQAAAILGIGQSWQNVSASRVSGTSYTNSTGKPIVVQLSGTLSAENGNYNTQVAGRGHGRPAWGGGFIGGSVSHSFIVPPGDTYSVVITSISSISWWEYR